MAEENKMGYHLTEIPKGVLGELSKIKEEILEAEDAEQQNNDVMVLLELSDALGAIELYLENYHPSITLDKLRIMSKATQRAFKNGKRQ